MREAPTKRHQEETKLLDGLFLTPVLLTLTDGAKVAYKAIELNDNLITIYLEDAKAGKPYPKRVELLDRVNEYSPTGLALAKGWLERLEDFIEGKRDITELKTE